MLKELNRLLKRKNHIMSTWNNESEERRKNTEKMNNEVKEGIEYRDKLIKKANVLDKELKCDKEFGGHIQHKIKYKSINMQ